MGLLAAELRKLRTVRTTWVLTAVGWGLIAFGAGFLILSDAFGAPFTGFDRDLANAIGQVGSNSVIVLVVAVMAVTTEFRHGTIGRTLQLVPSRTRMLLAKLGVGAAYAVVFFLTGLVVVAAFVGLGMLTGDVEPQIGAEVARALWQGPVGLMLTAAFGVAVGALLRSQVVALTLSLVWLFVVEPAFAFLVPDVGRWLPFQALNAVFVSEELMAGQGSPLAPVDPAAGLTVFLAYVAAATIAAGALLRYRDV